MRDIVYPPVILAARGLFAAMGLRFSIQGAQNVPRAGTPAQVLPGGSGQPNRPQISSLVSILEGA